jgi:hypothetical protein
MVKYGTYLDYLCYDFLLKENGAYSVQQLTVKLMPELGSPRERRNAESRVRRALDSLVFEQKIIKEAFYSKNMLAYKYSINEAQRVDGDAETSVAEV